ncbi:hypothetical protein B0H34DRAFT_675568 [Crassisporium funariophilum]|nr:hypothetical protein B0H34DRAFT_675568 [Crassisporium funariophilum]
MRLSILQIVLFMLTMVSSTISRSVPDPEHERRGSNSAVALSKRDNTALDTRQLEEGALGAIFLITFLSTLIANKIHQSTATVVPTPSDPNQSAISMLQSAANQLAANTDKSSVAVRLFVPQFPINWDGVLGQDWGTSLLTINAAEGQSVWNYYWVTTGTITVNTPNFANDVVLGGASMTTQDPNNPNLWTINIVRHS